MSGSQEYGNATPITGGGSLYNALAFMMKAMMAQNNSCHIVKVVGVTGGGPSAPPMVNCQILVNNIDGQGNQVPRGTIFNLPAMRHQAGNCAIINDPVVGDIGCIVCADTDISSVKVNKAPSAPGSFRQGSYADGMYIGGFINGNPTSYLEFLSDGTINFVGPQTFNINVTGNATVTANNVTLDGPGNLAVQGAITAVGNITAFFGGAAVDAMHVHTLVSTGDENSGPPLANS